MAIQEFIVSSAPVRPPMGVESFPLFEQAARHAADAWWKCVPLTLVAWRDSRFDAMQFGLGLDSEALHIRKRAFDIAFARRIGEVIAGAAGRI